MADQSQLQFGAAAAVLASAQLRGFGRTGCLESMELWHGNILGSLQPALCLGGRCFRLCICWCFPHGSGA